MGVQVYESLQTDENVISSLTFSARKEIQLSAHWIYEEAGKWCVG